MDDTTTVCARALDEEGRALRVARWATCRECGLRLHPNIAIDAAPSRRARPSIVSSVLARLGLLTTDSEPQQARLEGTGCAARAMHLRGMQYRLEEILGELDELGMHRAAIDVCSALEWVKFHVGFCERAEGECGPADWGEYVRSNIRDI